MNQQGAKKNHLPIRDRIIFAIIRFLLRVILIPVILILAGVCMIREYVEEKRNVDKNNTKMPKQH
jgi:Na+-transporting methylmalonyl-CoA/oxaloacetate decarboxylase beta subunit